MNYTITSTVPLAAKLVSINEQNLNWLPLIEIFTKNSTPDELAQSLLALYFCISDAAIASPEEVTTQNMRNDLMQLRQLYVAVHALGEESEEKIRLIVA